MREGYNPRFERRGYIQLFYGSGKSKSSASLGMAIRAIGHGWKVATILFTKGEDSTNKGFYGEVNTIKDYFPKDKWLVEQFGVSRVLYQNDIDNEIREEIERGFRFTNYIINSGEYDMVVMDEINICLDMGLIDIDKCVEMLQNKPQHVELVLTGRIEHDIIKEKIIKVSHLVTEGLPIKHYWQQGVKSRKGIEY